MDIKSCVHDTKSEKTFLETIIKTLRDYLASEKPYGEGSFDKITVTQIEKICFFTTRRLKVPATTSWYIFGGYCHNSVVRKNSIALIAKVNEKNLCMDHAKDISSTMEDYIKESKVFHLNPYDYMMDMYANEAPQEYKQLYLTHYPYINCIREYKEYLRKYLDDPINFKTTNICKKFSELKENFQRVYYNMEEFADIHDMQNEYNFLLEQVAYKIDYITQDNYRFPEEQLDEIKEYLKNLRDYYQNYVWGTSALQISTKTVTGISAKKTKTDNSIRKNQNKKQLPEKLEEYKKKAGYYNLLPSSSELAEHFGIRGKEHDEAILGLQNAYSRQ
jgi:hypothetical protein